VRMPCPNSTLPVCRVRAPSAASVIHASTSFGMARCVSMTGALGGAGLTGAPDIGATCVCVAGCTVLLMPEAVPTAGGALDIGAVIVGAAIGGALVAGTLVRGMLPTVGALTAGALIDGAGAAGVTGAVVGTTLWLLVLHADDHATTRPEPATPVSLTNWRRERRKRVGSVGTVASDIAYPPYCYCCCLVAANWIALTMRLYVPQRQRCPFIASRISASLECGFAASRAVASINCPDWQ